MAVQIDQIVQTAGEHLWIKIVMKGHHILGLTYTLPLGDSFYSFETPKFQICTVWDQYRKPFVSCSSVQ